MPSYRKNVIAALRKVTAANNLKAVFDKIYYDDSFEDLFQKEYGEYGGVSYPYDQTEFDQRYTLFLKDLNRMDGNKIYRAISVDSVDGIDWASIGISWTYDQTKAIPYWSKTKGREIVLVGQATSQNINPIATLTIQLTENYEESEKELRLKENAPIKITGYYLGDDFHKVDQKANTGTDPLKIEAALQTLAGVEDTDYPYYHVSDHPETPKPHAHEGTKHQDPSGLYLFYKGKDVNQTNWKPKKYRWDAKLKTSPHDVIDLDYDALVRKADITDIEGFIEELSKKHDVSMLEDDYHQWKVENENQDMWPNVGYPLLRYHFNDRDKFASFLKNQGVKALADPQGFTIFFGEPQVVVLDPSIIEWGEREENVSDNKVYVMADVKGAREAYDYATVSRMHRKQWFEGKHKDWGDDESDYWFDGNHRTEAAKLNGETTVEVVMPDISYRKYLESKHRTEADVKGVRETTHKDFRLIFEDDTITAYDNEDELAGELQIWLDVPEHKDKPYVGLVGVEPKHRRLGLAEFMYDWAEELYGEELIPSVDQTPEVRKLWEKRQKKKGVVAALRKITASETLSSKDLQTINNMMKRLYDKGISDSDWDWFEKSANEINNRLNNLPNPFPVYRAVCVDSLEDIMTYDLGPHWTYDKDSASCEYAGSKGDVFYLETEIRHNQVAVLQTIARLVDDFNYGEENEINPVSGTYEVKVYDDGWEYLDTLKGKIIEITL